MKKIEKELHYTQKNLLKSLNSWLQILLIISIISIILLSISLLNAINKPPVLIREFSNGSVLVTKNYISNDNIHKFDIIAFSKLFLNRYHSISSYGVISQLNKIAALMTSGKIKRYTQYISSNKLVDAYRNTGAFSKWKLKKMQIYKIAGGYVYVKFLGNSEMIVTTKREKILQTINGKLVLKIVNRSESSPFGLLLSHITETIIYQHITKLK